jgi:SAM-dependent methyltransferase
VVSLRAVQSTIGQPDAYEHIGGGYAVQRRPDPRIARQVRAALGDARTVLNVGAGAGSYEPDDLVVVAVEPSLVMLSQRSSFAAPALRAVAEHLPVRSGAFDAVLAVMTVHHWTDAAAGLAELCRVAPRRVVLTFDTAAHNAQWFIREYVPAVMSREQQRAPSVDDIADAIGATRVEVVPVAHDCVDGFMVAYWRRPHAYLDPEVRRAHSGVAQLDPQLVERGVEQLRADLESGRWYETHADLLDLTELDVGIRLVIADA